MVVLNDKFGVLLVCLTATVVAVVTVYFYQKVKKQKVSTDWIKVGKITKLCLYPLKSGCGINLQKAECTKVGLIQTREKTELIQLRDRGFVVYGSEDEECRTAKIYPNIILISIDTENEYIVIGAPEMPDLKFVPPTSPDNETLFVKCRYCEPIYGIDCGNEVASWVSKYLIKRTSGLRLAYNDGSRPRDFSKYRKKRTGHYENLNSDGAGLHSSASLMLANQKSIDEMTGHSNPTSDYSGANIVIDGDDLEADWDWIKVGNRVTMRNVKECTRCIITTINLEDGARRVTRGPLKTLETFRYRTKAKSKKAPVMGIHLEVGTGGRIQLGDPVYATKKQLNT